MTKIETLTDAKAWRTTGEREALRIIDAQAAEIERLRAEQGNATVDYVRTVHRAEAAEARLDTATALLGQFTASSMRMFCSPNSVMGQLLVRVDTFLANQPAAPCSHCESPDGHCPHHRPDAWKEPAVPALDTSLMTPEGRARWTAAPSFCKTCDDARRFGSVCSVHPQPEARAKAEQAVLDAMAKAEITEFAGRPCLKSRSRANSDAAAAELARRGLK